MFHLMDPPVFSVIGPAPVSEETQQLFHLTTDVVPKYNSRKEVFHFGQQYLLDKYNGRCVVQTEIVSLYDSTTLQFLEIRYERSIEQLFKELEICMSNHARVVFIALRLRPVDAKPMQKKKIGHHNLLIYRPYKKTIELHEPHGDSFVIGLNEALTQVVGTISAHFQQTQFAPILYKNAMFVCPALGLGLQGIECRDCGDPSEHGYCVLWNIFLMECILLNPELSTIEIIDACVHEVRTTENMKKMIRAYVLKMTREIKAHTLYLKRDADSEVDISESSKMADYKSYYGLAVTKKATSRSPDFLPERPAPPMSKSDKQQLHMYVLSLSAEQKTRACTWFGLEPCYTRELLVQMFKRGIKQDQLDHYLQTYTGKSVSEAAEAHADPPNKRPRPSGGTLKKKRRRNTCKGL